jgi:hypothetical protein
MGDVLEVTWLLRERDGKLTHDGWKTVTGRPHHVLMVEVIDPKKGIQDDRFYYRCARIAQAMKRVTLKCVRASHQPSEELPSAS